MGLFDNAIQMQPSPSISPFTQLLGVICKLRQYSTIITMFKSMDSSQIKFDIVALGTLINCFCQMGKVDFGFTVVGNIFKSGFEPDIVIFSTSLKGLFKENRVKHATDVTYGTMVDGLCKTGNVDQAIKLLKDIDKGNHKPNILIYNAIIDSLYGRTEKAQILLELMSTRSVSPDAVTYNSLIDGLCNSHQWEEANKLFREMIEKVLHSIVVRGCEPDVISCTILINGYGKAKKLDEAMQIFEDMRSKVGRVAAAQELFMKMQARGPSPNVYTYSTILDGLFTSSYEEAMRIFEKMDNDGLKANIVIYNTVINHMCKLNNWDAKKLLDSLPSKELQPDTQTFTSMINGLITKEMLKESEDLFTEMVEKGPTPDDITYNAIVRGSPRHKDIDKAMQLLNAMIDRGFSLNAINISIVEDLLAAHGSKSKFIGLVDKVLPKHKSKGNVIKSVV
ncbi:hypothetical protein GIB67_009719 [Kingdonia uniflora]|uniref:Pentatricopeptide repeat-containing protein n=1 Tax=Kingdonia uniflora TaxID=39325 RepID=A0A7J7LBE8_9MAGN|nr:hypothetical protein GIB67_009719 [Kingdonia uniflora]